MGFAVAGQRQPQRFLGASLADRTGHTDHFCLEPRTRGAAERPQPLQHIVDNEQRRVLRKPIALVRRNDT